MTPQEKLTEIFNINAGKVVEGRFLDKLFENGLLVSMDEDERAEFMALSQLSMGNLLNDKARTAALLQKTGDGTLGVYGGNNSVYFSVHFFEFALDLKNVPPALMGKVVNALSECFDMAPDFREQVKNGTLKPLKLKF